MDPIADTVSRKIKQLINEAIKDGFKINMGFILGGFSFCRSLVDKVQAEFAPQGFNISSFGKQSSLAIVMGATMFNRFNLKKSIP
jgi:hypoxanthine-guanine phosphoribosyltransferase